MQTSESTKEIIAALLEVQQEVDSVKKKGMNPHYGKPYTQLNDVIEAIKEPLNKRGVLFIQTPTTSDRGCALTTRLIHPSGEWIEDTATCPIAKNDPQGYGSAVTYLRRYSLVSIFGLGQIDDDGNDGSGLSEEKDQKPTNANIPPAAPSFRPTFEVSSLPMDIDLNLCTTYIKQIKELADHNLMTPLDIKVVVGSDIKSIAKDEKALEVALNKIRVATALGAKKV